MSKRRRIRRVSRTCEAKDGSKFQFHNGKASYSYHPRLSIRRYNWYGMYDIGQDYEFTEQELRKLYHGILKYLMMIVEENDED